jgi:hypothetical protein
MKTGKAANITPDTTRNSSSRKLWIVEVEHTRAHIYERTTEGTRWIGDAYLDHGQLCIDTPSREATHPLPDLPNSAIRNSRQFLAGFADWLDMAESRREFDKAVLVAAEPTMTDLQPALNKRLQRCVKLASDEMLVKNESEDNLARTMWH